MNTDREHEGTTFVAEHVLRAPNVNTLWAGLLVEELVRQGVGLFVVCPGSRSTPLAVAVARMAATGRAEWLVHPDERAAAFVALGWGRATGRPAAVITTSGSAVAHLFPAVVEADAAGVPLLLLTADRPPELRETGANQTIRQPGLFGSFVRWSFDVPSPTADVDPAFVLTTAAHTAHRSLAPAGPVHLNLAFREPLGLEPDGTDAAVLLAPLTRWTETERTYTRSGAPLGPEIQLPNVDELAGRLKRVSRGLIVLGPTDDPEVVGVVALLGVGLGWPVLCDAGSQGRLLPPDLGVGDAPFVPHYDLALASPSFQKRYRPEAALIIGGRPLSKRLLRFLDDARPDPFVIAQLRENRLDPGHRVTDRVVADLLPLSHSLLRAKSERFADDAWRREWRTAGAAAERSAIARMGRALSEPLIARTVAGRAPTNGALVLAASMPVRDVDTFAASTEPSAHPEKRPARVVANRGASGIDGTVATAHGVARGLNAPTVALVGDLAMLHDQTSLMLLRSGPPVVVVVVNNDGGGIFHHLPIARGPHAVDADTFEAVFGTPHGLTFEHAAAQVGLAYHAPTTADAFEAALDKALASGASAVIEVRTDRAESAALRVRITQAVSEAVDAALGLPPAADASKR